MNIRALARRFQKIDIKEPTPHESVEILKGLRKKYESFHNLTYTDQALEAAVNLSVRHLPDKKLPDKGIDVMDESGAHASIELADSDSPIEVVPQGTLGEVDPPQNNLGGGSASATSGSIPSSTPEGPYEI